MPVTRAGRCFQRNKGPVYWIREVLYLVVNLYYAIEPGLQYTMILQNKPNFYYPPFIFPSDIDVSKNNKISWQKVSYKSGKFKTIHEKYCLIYTIRL